MNENEDTKVELRHSAVERAKMALKNPKIWQLGVALVIMALISIAFFHPDAVEGNTLQQHDMLQGQAIGEETRSYQEQTGEKSWWTNSLFAGMPTFQISPTYSSNALFSWISTLYGLGLPSPSNLLFMMMAGMMILMMAMNVKWYYGIIGAIAWGFSTYFIIIIGAGHIWKFITLSYIPPTIAGIYMAYRGRWLMGSALAALFAMMQIASNHVQMTYYFLFVIVAMVIAFFVEALRSKRLRRWGIATCSLAVAGMLAVAANMPSLYNTYEYSKETMRGNHSELTQAAATDDADKTSGLDRSYITQYSYGRSETFSLFIPNIKGGASAKPVKGQMQVLSVGNLDEVAKLVESGKITPTDGQFLGYMSQYFGEPEGTNGPIYVGVLVFALFLVGCFAVKGPLKWALLAMTVISVLLALGRNCMWLTDLFIDYVPMYSKFRTVESILVIAEFTIPVLAILGLQRVLTSKDSRQKYSKTVFWCFGVVAFFCLMGIFMPGFFGNVITPQDEQISGMITQQLMQQGYPRDVATSFSIDNPHIYLTLKTLRYQMIEADSLRSLAFLAAGFVFIYLFMSKKVSMPIAAVALGVVVLTDLYSVNKRYLNHDSFVEKSFETVNPFPLTASDRQILADTAMNYRVMDLPQFWAAAPSFHHKAIGGYHAAKLTRYQDIIDRHLNGFIYGRPTDADYNVLNMLNGKYIVTGGENGVVLNDQALGNAWFVENISFVDTPDAEMDALSQIDPATEAVADVKFKGVIGKTSLKQPGDTIFETLYAPNRLTYHAQSKNGGLAVFSEVYFPFGWKAKIDGEDAEIGRVNYLLRAIDIPAGTHSVEMVFDPDSIKVTETVAAISVWLIYAMLLLAIVNLLMHYRLAPDEDETV